MANRTEYIFAGAGALLILLLAGGYFLLRPKEANTNTVGAVLTNNGFVELRPPSNLFLPGTWVEVLNSNPLRLSIICGPKSALGLSDTSQTASSKSAAVSFESELKPKFSLDTETLKSLKAKVSLAAARQVTLSLSNVRLLEIPDDAVFEGFKNRTPGCGTAIGFRIKEQKNPVSMVKSVLVADVTYKVEFAGDLSADAKATAIKDLALNLSAQLDNSDSTKTQLVGQDLSWGIRDDTVLARYGYGLPSTGGTTSHPSALLGHGPVVGAKLSSTSREDFSGKKKL